MLQKTFRSIAYEATEKAATCLMRNFFIYAFHQIQFGGPEEKDM
jgi:hypothetical protein